jgi:hypothetical protein
MNPEGPRTALTEWSEAQAAQNLNAWRRLFALGPAQRYGDDVVLFSQGDAIRELFLLASGIVKFDVHLTERSRIPTYASLYRTVGGTVCVWPRRS